MDKVSVAILMHNDEKYIARCLQSVIEQTYKNIEIVIVDDCSTDKGALIVGEFKKKYKNIKFYKNKSHKGTFLTRRNALKKCSGKYIFFVDSDDFIDNDYIEKEIKVFKDKLADIVISSHRVIDNENSRVIKYNIHYERNGGIEFLFKNNVFVIQCWNGYKKELINRAMKDIDKIAEDANEICMGEDLLLSAIMYYHSQKIYSCDDTFYNYCFNDTQTVNVSNEEKYKKTVQSSFKAFNCLKKLMHTWNIWEKYRQSFEHIFNKFQVGFVSKGFSFKCIDWYMNEIKVQKNKLFNGE